MIDLLHPVIHFASAGGGGSGGGGSGGSGGGGILGLYYMVGYFVATKTKRKLHVPGAIIFASVVVLLLSWVFISDLFIWALIVFAGGVGVHNGIIGILGKFRDMAKGAKKDLSTAQLTNQVEWNEPLILIRVKDVFMSFQRDWSNQDLNSMYEYLTPHYQAHVALMIAAMQQLGRTNKMSNVVIRDTVITKVSDVVVDSEDRLDVTFDATAADELIDKVHAKTLYSTKGDFIETWHFVRSNNKWMLEGITPATTVPQAMIDSMQTFANENDLYFSPNWGKLLLPRRGQLFAGGSFKLTTRVDNHIIGIWDNLLVQIYSLTNEDFRFMAGGNSYVTHTIGQLTLPKTYGGIIVDDKRSALRGIFGQTKKPKGYTKYTLEWGDFNKRYNLYATDQDKITSFELLNPAFMAWLYDFGEHMSIEVVDNVVYIHCKTKDTDNRYGAMLEVLKRSYDELKR